jgi:hypothetical protein
MEADRIGVVCKVSEGVITEDLTGKHGVCGWTELGTIFDIRGASSFDELPRVARLVSTNGGGSGA